MPSEIPGMSPTPSRDTTFPGRPRQSRRALLAGAGALAGAVLCSRGLVLAQQATPVATPLPAARDWRAERWVGTWAAAPHIASPGFGEEFPSQIIELDNQTMRQYVRASAGGEQVRVRLSNVFGNDALVIGAAHIALRGEDGQIDPATDRTLTFSGLPATTIPAGALALSDPVALTIPPLSSLAVSLYVPRPTTTTTVHGFSLQTNDISTAGDFTAEVEMPGASAVQGWAFLTGIDVAVPAPAGVVVALGDSITDGFGSTPETNQRWPDILAERLADAREGQPVAVLNQGIGGNRLLHDGTGGFSFAGPSALARFDRDVLAQTGVTHLIVFEGINDIGLPAMTGDTAEAVNAGDMIAALRQLAERAHEQGIVAIGATITPCEGAMYISAEGEAIRQAVNAWIRDGGAFDAVLDFDAVVQDPDNPASILPAFDSGDHLHINDAGYRAMAESIDLSLFAGIAEG